jgi:peptidoglycan/LPS O-acetylase OafA/YrhL
VLRCFFATREKTRLLLDELRAINVSRNQHQGRLPELDGWRAICACLVILHHFFVFQHGTIISGFRPVLHVFFFAGRLGVFTFFVISGFVICRLLVDEERRFGSISISAFYIRRAFRILPAAALYFVAVITLYWLGYLSGNWSAILRGLFFVSDFKPQQEMWFVEHTWSLSVEQQFYLLFPLLWLLVPVSARKLAFSAVFAIAVVWNLAFAIRGFSAQPDSVTRAGFACVSWGVLLALHEDSARRLAALTPSFAIALLWGIGLAHPARDHTIASCVFEGLGLPLIIGVVLLHSLERGPLLRAFLCSKPVQAVGITSYGLYLWQQLFTANSVMYQGAGEFIPALLPALPLVVAFSYFFLEKPALRLGRAISSYTSVRSAAAVDRERKTQQQCEATAESVSDR